MSKKKTKSKHPPASFEVRLQRCWDRQDWAAFVSLYVSSPREKAVNAPAGRYFGAAVYNSMTTALFTEKNVESATLAAETILKEEMPAVMRNCARTVLDFQRLQNQGFAPLEQLEKGKKMPPPYDRLRHEMESLVNEHLKECRNGPASLLETLSRQYAGLPEAKNSVRFNSCCKTAEELRKATESLPCAGIFANIAVLFGIIRDIHSSGHPFREACAVFMDERLGLMSLKQGHPLVFSLWEYLCRAGGTRYGKEWEAQARAIQGMFLCGQKDAVPSRIKLQMAEMITGLDAYEDWEAEKTETAGFLMENPSLWDTLEAYFLDLMTILSTYGLGKYWGLDPAGAVIIFERIVRNGRKLRPEAPLPPILLKHLLHLLPDFPLSSLRDLLRLGFPVKELPAIIVARMACEPWWNSSVMERELADRLPLSFSLVDKVQLEKENFPGNPKIHALQNLEKILDDESLRIFAESWFWQIIIRSHREGIAGKKTASRPWAGLNADILTKYRDMFPKDSLVSRFCSLCCGTKRFTLSSDPGLVEEFYKGFSKPVTINHFKLYAWLLTWPETTIPFLHRLGELTYSFCKSQKYWDEIYESVASIENKARRELIARDIVTIWTIIDTSGKKDPYREKVIGYLWKL